MKRRKTKDCFLVAFGFLVFNTSYLFCCAFAEPATRFGRYVSGVVVVGVVIVISNGVETRERGSPNTNLDFYAHAKSFYLKNDSHR